ncbi:MAG: hypothetical protein R2744_02225 [Bacteroidales bacterium]
MHGFIWRMDSVHSIAKMENYTFNGALVIDASGRFVFPSYCDSHTHLVYAGSRKWNIWTRFGDYHEEILKGRRDTEFCPFTRRHFPARKNSARFPWKGYLK